MKHKKVSLHYVNLHAENGISLLLGLSNQGG
jgi:hypothetical protein